MTRHNVRQACRGAGAQAGALGGVYLPRGLVLAEVGERRDEPRVNLVERQLLLGRVQDRLVARNETKMKIFLPNSEKSH